MKLILFLALLACKNTSNEKSRIERDINHINNEEVKQNHEDKKNKKIPTKNVEEEIIACILKNNKKEIKNLVESNNDIYKKDKNNLISFGQKIYTALAAYPNHTIGLAGEFIIDISNDFDVKYPTKGETPMHLAVQHENVDMVRYLIRRGANHEILDNDNLSPLGRIINKLRALNTTKHNINSENYEGHVERISRILLLLIEKAKDISVLFSTPVENYTPLQLIIESIPEDVTKIPILTVLKEILKKEFNLDFQDEEGNTYLHLAIQNKKIKMAHEILDVNKIDINTKNKHKKTPADLAFETLIKLYQTETEKSAINEMLISKLFDLISNIIEKGANKSNIQKNLNLIEDKISLTSSYANSHLKTRLNNLRNSIK